MRLFNHCYSILNIDSCEIVARELVFYKQGDMYCKGFKTHIILVCVLQTMLAPIYN